MYKCVFSLLVAPCAGHGAWCSYKRDVRCATWGATFCNTHADAFLPSSLIPHLLNLNAPRARNPRPVPRTPHSASDSSPHPYASTPYPPLTETFGAPVSVAVQCGAMATAMGGFQHPIPWVVYACVEELNRTGAFLWLFGRRFTGVVC